MNNGYVWSVAILLVAVFAHSRFNTPATTRSSTTRAQFYFAEISYVVCSLLLLVLLSGLIVASPDVVKLVSGDDSNQLAKAIDAFSSPLAAALVMTTLLPHFPIISQIDCFLLDAFRDIGNIPVEVRRLASSLRGAQLEITDAEADAYAKFLAQKLEVPKAIIRFLEANKPGQPEYRVNEIIHLAMRLSQWRENAKFADACTLFREELESVLGKSDELIKLTSRLVSIFSQASGGKGPVARVQAELRRQILRDCELLRENICNFAAQGILQCAPTRRERDRAIREMGFVMPSRPAAGLSATKLVSYAATVFLILFTGISLLQMSLGDPNTGLSKAFVMSVMVACIYGAAICCAIAPKGLWDFADIHKLKIRPAIGYLVSGLLAFGAAAAISFVFKSMIFLDFRRAFFDILVTFPWFGMSFVAACVLAFLIDDYALNPADAPKMLRLVEALAAGVALSAAAFLIVHAIPEVRGLVNLPAGMHPPGAPRSWQQICPIAFAIGLFLGYEVPHWVRLRPPLHEESELLKTAPTSIRSEA
jgi:hypothetical protein